MKKIYYLIGKSSTGKDSLLEALLKDEELGLEKIVQYTTRPIRGGEVEGREYHFISDDEARRMEAEGRIVEERAYNTVHGIWKYMFVDDEKIRTMGPFIAVGTIESYRKIRDYYGEDNVFPVYIYVETGERLTRALEREKNHENPKYAEMCRRFLADEEDFRDEKLQEAGLMMSDGTYLCGVENDDFDRCLETIRALIRRSEGKTDGGK